MNITALVENIAHTPEFEARHGLSFYIETQRHKLLFDLGPDDAFLQNAGKLGVDLAAVDTVVISHGHYDHGGGLALFLQQNPHAAVYISGQAFGQYYAKDETREAYVGLDPALPRDRFVFTGAELVIDEELHLFSRIAGSRLQSQSSSMMVEKQGDAFVQDAFLHEQSLIITQGDKKILLGGCAHSGIINILERAEQIAGPIHTLVSGFHLMAPTESTGLIEAIADELARRPTRCYTCHCTGERAYQIMRERLPGQMQYLACGMQLVID